MRANRSLRRISLKPPAVKVPPHSGRRCAPHHAGTTAKPSCKTRRLPCRGHSLRQRPAPQCHHLNAPSSSPHDPKKGRSQKAGTQRPQRSGTGLVLLRSATAACRRVWPTWQVSSTKLRVTPQPPETTLRAVRSAVHPVCHIRATSPWSLSQRQAKPPAKGVDALQTL